MKKLSIIFRLVNIILILSRLNIDKLVLRRAYLWPFRLLTVLLPRYRSIKMPLTRGQALKKAAIELGPLFVKFGQAIAIRRDIFPDDITKELSYLHDQVDSFNSDIAVTTIETSLGGLIGQFFKEFEKKPLASASIAQVHSAHLMDGTEVIIKVLRPNIKKEICKDIAVLQFFAKWITKLFPSSARYRLTHIVNEFERTLLNEIDLTREAANASKLRRNFIASKLLYVPKIYWDLTKKNILVMEKIKGIPIDDIQKLKKHKVNIKKLAETGVEIFFTQVFRDKFFHADMHPGNIFVSYDDPDNPKYIAVDFGIMGTINSSDQSYLAANFMAFFKGDFQEFAHLHKQSGWIAPNVNLEEFSDEIRILSEPIFDKPLKDISFAYLLLKLFKIGRKFNMHIQPQLLLFQKTLFAVEGLGLELYPDLNLWDTAKPYLEKWQNNHIDQKLNLAGYTKELAMLAQHLPKTPALLFNTLSHIREKQLTDNYAMQDLQVAIGKSNGVVHFIAGVAVAVVFGVIYLGLF